VDAWSGSHPPTKTLPFHGDIDLGRQIDVPAILSRTFFPSQTVTDMVRGQAKNPYTTFWFMFFGLEGDCQRGTGHFIGFSNGFPILFGYYPLVLFRGHRRLTEGMQYNYVQLQGSSL